MCSFNSWAALSGYLLGLPIIVVCLAFMTNHSSVSFDSKSMLLMLKTYCKSFAHVIVNTFFMTPVNCELLKTEIYGASGLLLNVNLVPSLPRPLK